MVVKLMKYKTRARETSSSNTHLQRFCHVSGRWRKARSLSSSRQRKDLGNVRFVLYNIMGLWNTLVLQALCELVHAGLEYFALVWPPDQSLLWGPVYLAKEVLCGHIPLHDQPIRPFDLRIISDGGPDVVLGEIHRSAGWSCMYSPYFVPWVLHIHILIDVSDLI